MNKSVLKLLVFLAMVHTSVAGESVTPNIWTSPNSKYELIYQQVNAILGDAAAAANPAPYLFLLKEDGLTKWVGQVQVDESAHDSHAIWSPDSHSALLLIRPNRGACYAYLLSPTSQETIFDFHVDALIKDILRKAKDDDWHDLVKAWFGSWKWVSDHTATGTIHFSKAHAYTANIKIVTEPPKIEVVSVHQETDKGDE